jgi:dGTP triphosphohydrolase
MEMIMSTLVLNQADALGPSAEKKPWRSFERLVQARENEARRRVTDYLASQTDERLAGLGVDSEGIAALRRGQLRLPSR